MSLLKSLQMRRSRYELSDKLPISDREVERLIGQCIELTPSAFNSQSARVMLLLGQAHKRLWEITLKELRPLVPPEGWGKTQDKINLFAAAHGTVLYFDDISVVHALQQQFPTYKDNFPIWAQQANGMLQLVVWTALAEKGIGASLQHYNPLIDAAVSRAFGVSADWQLRAQMPFGTPLSTPPEKTQEPLSKRFVVKSQPDAV